MKPIAQEFVDTGGDTPENSFETRTIVAVDKEKVWNINKETKVYKDEGSSK